MHAGQLLPGNTSLVLKFNHALCICSRTQSRKQNTDTHANSLAISTRVVFILRLCLSLERLKLWRIIFMTDKKFIICHATLYCFSVVVCMCVWVYLGVNTCAIASSRPRVSALHVLLVQQQNNCQLCVEKINYIILIGFQIGQRFLEGVEVKLLNMPGKWKLPTRQTTARTGHIYKYVYCISLGIFGYLPAWFICCNCTGNWG